MIRNFLSCQSEAQQSSHSGHGTIHIQKVFRRVDFDGAWDFALRVIMEPNSAMGLHRHGEDEEMYIILKGEGVMTVDGQESRVGPGDMIYNRPNGEHGLLNDSADEIELLIIQASNKCD